MTDRQPLVSCWLLPAEPAATHLRHTIELLSRAHDAPRFAPHITLWSGFAREKMNWHAVLEQAARAIAPFEVAVNGIGHSRELWRSLYLKLESSEILLELSQRLRAALSATDDYALEPHLSLMYRTLPADQRKQLAEQVRVPPRFVCDALSLVVPGPGGFSDVAAWTQPATCALGDGT